jgi:hypothetical protein
VIAAGGPLFRPGTNGQQMHLYWVEHHGEAQLLVLLAIAWFVLTGWAVLRTACRKDDEE